MKKAQLIIANDLAYHKKMSLNGDNNFDIRELHLLPLLFDFVGCHINNENKFCMFLGGGDDGVALRFFWNGHYEKKTLSLWSDLCSKVGGVIIDIGAHTGTYTLAALSFNNNIEVISFEPHFMNFSRLLLNIRTNQFKNSRSFMMCVGDENKLVPFSISTDINYLSAGGSVGSRDKGIVSNIQQISLDSFLPQNVIETVSLIKIDVEGYESNCLKGMHKILQNGPTIFFECIDSKSGHLVHEILSKYNYHFYEIDDLTGSVTAVKNIVAHYDENNQILMNRINRIASVKKLFD